MQTGDYTTWLNWMNEEIKPIEGIIVGVRILSNGEMTKEGFFHTESFKAYLVAINLKQILKVNAKYFE